jgi:hypothetical protein
MSDIPKSERSESPLRAQHLVYNIRKRITAELMATFGYSQKRFEKHIKAVTAYVVDDGEREELAKRIREQEEDFNLWFIQQERTRVLIFCQDISVHMRAANTIWPEYWPEFEERRLQWDKTMECCNMLQDELQYIAEVLPADKNKYTSIVLEIEHLFKTIKSLRQSDNRFKKYLKGPKRSTTG